MASVSGMSSNNMASLYGNRNVISGLASGMDTESMIQNSVSGIRYKISGLQQRQTSLQWKQSAYQGITDKLVQFSRKYTSYTSATNLLSPSFFNRAILTTTGGENASKVSASGRSTSSVTIDGVHQLASAGRYQSNQSDLLDRNSNIQADSSVDILGKTDVSNFTGSMDIKYGDKTITLNFKESDKLATADELKATIEEKLQDITITTSSGASGKASEYINVKLDGDKLSFTDKKAAGNAVAITELTGKLEETFKPDNLDFSDKESPVTSLNLAGKDFTTPVSMMEQIGGKTMNFTLDGVSKKITAPTLDDIKAYKADNGGTAEQAFVALLNERLGDSFGKGKVTVSDLDSGKNAMKLDFKIAEGSALTLSSEINKSIGLADTETSYLNMGRTIVDLLGEDFAKDMQTNGKDIKGVGLEKDDPIKQKDGSYRDKAGNTVDEDGYRLGKDGERLKGIELKINNTVVGTYHRDSAMETVLLDINNNSDLGVSVSYSKLTNQFAFVSSATGEGNNIRFENGGLAEKLFGTYDATKGKDGKDAIITMTVNDEPITVKRSSNTFDVDGMSVTVNEAFNHLDKDGNAVVDQDGKPIPGAQVDKPTGSVTFSSASDVDKVVEAITSFVKDYNEMVTDLRKAFNTLPAKKSNGSKYEPLTESDLESMSDSAIEAYEEKAKQGIVFGDRDLSSLYNKLSSAISSSGVDGVTMRSIGLETDFSQGLSTINLDESKLRDMLKTNPDTVRDVFTKVAGENGNTNGLMTNLKSTIDTYASTEGVKGILINKAGSKYSATSLLQNTMKDQNDALEKEIEVWQDKLVTKVDYYTRQYTRLEQIIAQANSQSESLMSMMMGG